MLKGKILIFLIISAFSSDMLPLTMAYEDFSNRFFDSTVNILKKSYNDITKNKRVKNLSYKNVIKRLKNLSSRLSNKNNIDISGMGSESVENNKYQNESVAIDLGKQLIALNNKNGFLRRHKNKKPIIDISNLKEVNISNLSENSIIGESESSSNSIIVHRNQVANVSNLDSGYGIGILEPNESKRSGTNVHHADFGAFEETLNDFQDEQLNFARQIDPKSKINALINNIASDVGLALKPFAWLIKKSSKFVWKKSLEGAMEATEEFFEEGQPGHQILEKLQQKTKAELVELREQLEQRLAEHGTNIADTIEIRVNNGARELRDNVRQEIDNRIQRFEAAIPGAIDAARERVVEELQPGGLIPRAANQISNQLQPGQPLRAVVDRMQESVVVPMANTARERLAVPVANIIHEKYESGAALAAKLTLVTIAGYYIIKFIFSQVDKYINQPTLIIKSSKENLFKKFKTRLFGKRETKLPKLVFDSDLEAQVENVVASTKNISQKIAEGKKNIKHRNLLLWGPSGTGKTRIAERIALESGMDFVIMTGSSFSKFKSGKGISAMDELFQWANKSEKGLIIFIDEAESFLGERKKEDIHDESYQLLNNFYNHTGNRSDKFKLIFATNHPGALDIGMSGRIDDSIEISLPKVAERSRILHLYRGTILLDEKENSKEFVESVRQYLTDEKIAQIATKTEKFSGRELEGIINSLKTDADITASGLITTALIDMVVEKAIRKNKEFAFGFIKSKLDNPGYDDDSKRHPTSSATV